MDGSYSVRGGFTDSRIRSTILGFLSETNDCKNQNILQLDYANMLLKTGGFTVGEGGSNLRKKKRKERRKEEGKLNSFWSTKKQQAAASSRHASVRQQQQQERKRLHLPRPATAAAARKEAPASSSTSNSSSSKKGLWCPPIHRKTAAAAGTTCVLSSVNQQHTAAPLPVSLRSRLPKQRTVAAKQFLCPFKLPTAAANSSCCCLTFTLRCHAKSAAGAACFLHPSRNCSRVFTAAVFRQDRAQAVPEHCTGAVSSQSAHRLFPSTAQGLFHHRLHTAVTVSRHRQFGSGRHDEDRTAILSADDLLEESLRASFKEKI
ncbi:hypothetical protein Ccrd_012794 [Cynara cardunculus var. scolymus]|uniref:Uncharacterized protein n=1 Tax=Cynara cardunculus var. scolymus TaxID=59895 RepID=A0A124SH91_CYNCS|nr:hypothetical protein Ccrd_012794 [Cynara cardunculus var. scolymus]